MICPILVVGYLGINNKLLKGMLKRVFKRGRYHVQEEAQCKEEECAWWIEMHGAEEEASIQGCSIPLIAEGINLMRGRI